jgi:hypothetical protein
MDCFVANAPRNDEETAEFVGYISSQASQDQVREFEPIDFVETIG